jgi:hypothetical protein
LTCDDSLTQTKPHAHIQDYIYFPLKMVTFRRLLE